MIFSELNVEEETIRLVLVRCIQTFVLTQKQKKPSIHYEPTTLLYYYFYVILFFTFF